MLKKRFKRFIFLSFSFLFFWQIFLYAILPILFQAFESTSLNAAQIQLKDGRKIQGESSAVARIDAKIDPGKVQTKNITVIDDGLRRIFVSKKNVVDVFPDEKPLEVFRFPQRYARSETAGKLEVLGDYRPVEPYAQFDKYGRRLVSLAGPDGLLYETQSIVEINSRYVRARGLRYIWDARYGTITFPHSVLSPILRQVGDPNRFEDRMKVFTFFALAEYYEAAEAELAAIEHDFKDDPKLKNNRNITYAKRRMRQLTLERLERELQMRSEAGQHQQVLHLLNTFPTEDAGLVLQRVRRMLDNYHQMDHKRERILQRLEELADSYAKDENAKDEYKENIAELLTEIQNELNPNTIPRFESFLLNDQDASMPAEEKLALGLSSWILGNDAEIRRMTVAASLIKTRNLVLDYLRQNQFAATQEIYNAIVKEEAGTPEIVVQILKSVRPPLDNDIKTAADPQQPGFFQLERPGVAGSSYYETIPYLVQLPPEYDPNRKYPTIVTLHSNTSSPGKMLDWWCGSWQDGYRLGQATRHGYIVIAPYWAMPGQMSYDYTVLPHAAVLYALSDASVRFSIDRDKVFLTGHGMGGDAAWDIGAAHPDLWAGVIPFGGMAKEQVFTYAENMQHVPFYYIGGELESGESGGRLRNKTTINGPTLNHYLRSGFNATVVQYLGRGAETFGEETLELYKWMKNLKRTTPEKFTVCSIRPQNNFYFFWGIEYPELPSEANWPRDNKGKIDVLETTWQFIERANRIKISTKGRFSRLNPVIYLTPEMIRFNQRIEIEFDNKKIHPYGFVEPDLRVILEDARTRKDRQHPFWVMLKPM